MSSSFVDGPVQASLAVGTCEEQVGRMNSAGSRESVEELNHWSRGGLRGVPASWFLPWHERRYAARASGDLLALYRTAKADHPDWVARELPQTGGLDPSRARFDGGRRDPEMCQREHRGVTREARVGLVRCGAGPVGDGVSRGRVDDSGIHSNIARVVTSHIPHDLCISRGNLNVRSHTEFQNEQVWRLTCLKMPWSSANETESTWRSHGGCNGRDAGRRLAGTRPHEQHGHGSRCRTSAQSCRCRASGEGARSGGVSTSKTSGTWALA